MIQRICCGNVNCYIVANGKTAVLVDTGREKFRQKVLDACRGFDMRLLILTHGHVDHVQNAAFLAETFGIPIAMHKADVPLLGDNMLQPLFSRGILGRLVLSASIKSFREDEIPGFAPNFFLEDGDQLEDYGIPAKVVGLPGHTKGSIGLDVMEKHLIVGDALMNMFYPSISMLYNDKAAMLQSADKISQLGKRQIYFGHGRPLSNRNWTKREII